MRGLRELQEDSGEERKTRLLWREASVGRLEKLGAGERRRDLGASFCRGVKPNSSLTRRSCPLGLGRWSGTWVSAASQVPGRARPKSRLVPWKPAFSVRLTALQCSDVSLHHGAGNRAINFDSVPTSYLFGAQVLGHVAANYPRGAMNRIDQAFFDCCVKFETCFTRSGKTEAIPTNCGVVE